MRERTTLDSVMSAASGSFARTAIRRYPGAFLLFFPTLTACPPTEPGEPSPAPPCEAPSPPAEARLKAGDNGGVFLLPGGRAITPAGSQLELGGFPVDLEMNAARGVVYVANTGLDLRAVQVVRLSDGQLLQEFELDELWYGLALAPDGSRLFAAGGRSGRVEALDVADDGTLSAAGFVELGGYPAGLAFDDGGRLWAGRFLGDSLAEIDPIGLTVLDEIDLPFGAYGVGAVPGRDEVYVAGFGDARVAVVDVALGEVAAEIELPSTPQTVLAAPDGGHVWVTVPDGDRVVAVDTAARAVVADASLKESSVADPLGNALPATSPTGIALDAAGGRLFVARAGDNAVSVLDADTLAPSGSIPTAWYPTATAFDATSSTLVVANGKGIGSGANYDYELDGPELSAKHLMRGTLSLVDLSTLDSQIGDWTQQADENLRRPDTVYPFVCESSFPVPTQIGEETPIEHVVLIVRENKTYDAVLGDLGVGDAEPALTLFGEDITPNLHALARRFAHHDNFYNDSEASVQGHLWLTSSFVTDYMERAWLEDYRGAGAFADDSVSAAGQPDFGTLFTHLLKHRVSFINYGEIVGALGRWEDQFVVDHTDTDYPGGFFNLDVKDEERATYVTQQLVDLRRMPSFTFLLLPNDHTQGTSAGQPTPESMVNDNDYATGLVVDRISHSEYWEKTVIFVVEDDPQQGADHVDAHRSILLVISPWAKRGHISPVHSSFPSIFRTIELILGVPPMNRYDALATPLWDAFTSSADMEPYTALPRTVPDEVNPSGARGQEESEEMDFTGPDRNPHLGALLWWHRKGTPPPGNGQPREWRVEAVGGEEEEYEGDWAEAVERVMALKREREARRGGGGGQD
jgi:YVTN family beta-propeller protein